MSSGGGLAAMVGESRISNSTLASLACDGVEDERESMRPSCGRRATTPRTLQAERSGNGLEKGANEKRSSCTRGYHDESHHTAAALVQY